MPRIGPFAGIAPRLQDEFLGDNQATVAHGARLNRGALRAWRGSVKVADAPRVGVKRTIYRYGQDRATDADYWFHWTADVDVVRSTVAADERTFFTGDGAPKVTTAQLALTGGGALPNASRDLGLPAPTQAPFITLTGTADAGTTASDRFAVYTWVDDFGQESAPSPISLKYSAAPGQTINAAFPSPPAGATVYVGVRFYETAGTGQTANFFLKADGVSPTAGTASFAAAATTTPDLSGTGIGSPLKTRNFLPPPADLTALRAMPGNTLVGLSGGAVRFSEAGYPYAWNPLREYKLDHAPVGIGVFASTCVVPTKGNAVYIFTGYNPAGMQQSKIEKNVACVAKRSICEVDGGVVFATESELVMVTAGGVESLTEMWIDRDAWRGYNPASMQCVWWDKRIWCFHALGCLVLQPGAEPVTVNVVSTAAWVDPLRDALYIVVGNEIHRFDAGAEQPYAWQSKRISHPFEVSHAFAKVIRRGPGSCTLKTYADGVLVSSVAVDDSWPFAINDGTSAMEWQFRLEGTAEVSALVWGESWTEAMRG